MLGASLRADLRRWSEQSAPHEACGFLIGRRIGDTSIVARATLEANVHLTPLRAFTVDPVAVLRAHDAAAACSLHVIGVWHSHPASDSAVPSAADTSSAWPGHVAWIVARRQSRAYCMGIDGLTPLTSTHPSQRRRRACTGRKRTGSQRHDEPGRPGA